MFQPDSGNTSTAVYVVLLSAVVFVYSRLRMLELKISSVERLLLNADTPSDIIDRLEAVEMAIESTAGAEKTGTQGCHEAQWHSARIDGDRQNSDDDEVPDDESDDGDGDGSAEEHTYEDE